MPTPRSHLSIHPTADEALDWLRRHGTEAARTGMARYAIPSDRAFGVSVGNIQSLAKQLGRSHALALQLWGAGWYEARMLAAYVDEPDEVAPAQMDLWCKDFDNWAICDTVCFALFDRTLHAWPKFEQWSSRHEEFCKRGAFALLWGLSVHDKEAPDELFVESLVLVEQASTDERNFVKKAVDMALRAVGKRNAALRSAALTVAERLAASPDATARWIGKSAVRELNSASVIARTRAIQRMAQRT